MLVGFTEYKLSNGYLSAAVMLACRLTAPYKVTKQPYVAPMDTCA